VGSRHLTYYGRKATEQIVTECAAAGITIVSGFMYGGDEAAHSAAIKCGGRTIAIMPCGINIIHPPQHKKLYQDILDNNSLIISEYEGDFLPQTWSYVQRDRIVAGLSKAVLVTEAALDSGSLITASYAKKYGRKIFAIPGQITSEVSKGTLKLIKEGAEPVAEAQDILSYYKVLLAQRSLGGVGVNQKSVKSDLTRTIIVVLLSSNSSSAFSPITAYFFAISISFTKIPIGFDLSRFFISKIFSTAFSFEASQTNP